MNRLTTILTVGFLATLFGCGQDKSNDESNNTANQPITKPVENIVATKDQKERRARSEAFCKSKGIPVYGNPNSLFVDPEDKVTIRTKDEIVDRAMALCYLELISEKADKKMLAEFDKKYNVISKLTAAEKEFALSDHPTEQQMTNANWRAESYHAMLWALGYIDGLKYPNEVCNVSDDVKHLFSKTEKEFRDDAKLRSKVEILDQADLILRLDWACVNASVKNEVAPSGLDKSIVYERHYSLNWLIKFLNQDWDKVTTDT
ncbi:DUF4272 domain-containing protein [Pedobacter frigidisoli]|uniref:DUF4272 domain-containing protein n=1 Tax=Pedobacter frigidisoli TaxID=2530455 RepID=A0A4R0NQN7_9SPHI|nr:DUF4272 domain-containing protein [Pedobacter frigidisoli]TCD02113.1 DUF4272 domain-containing protein [Pedobacter frigidisoli]